MSTVTSKGHESGPMERGSPQEKILELDAKKNKEVPRNELLQSGAITLTSPLLSFGKQFNFLNSHFPQQKTMNKYLLVLAMFLLLLLLNV